MYIYTYVLVVSCWYAAWKCRPGKTTGETEVTDSEEVRGIFFVADAEMVLTMEQPNMVYEWDGILLGF